MRERKVPSISNESIWWYNSDAKIAQPVNQLAVWVMSKFEQAALACHHFVVKCAVCHSIHVLCDFSWLLQGYARPWWLKLHTSDSQPKHRCVSRRVVKFSLVDASLCLVTHLQNHTDIVFTVLVIHVLFVLLQECHCMLFLTEDNDFRGDDQAITLDEVSNRHSMCCKSWANGSSETGTWLHALCPKLDVIPVFCTYILSYCTGMTYLIYCRSSKAQRAWVECSKHKDVRFHPVLVTYLSMACILSPSTCCCNMFQAQRLGSKQVK